MKTKPYALHCAAVAALLAISLSVYGHSKSYSYKESAVPSPVKLSPRLQALFHKPKILCFGRYAVEVPQEAQLLWGSVNDIDVVPEGFANVKHRVTEDIARAKRKFNTAEITYDGPGPIAHSWQLRYFEDELAKRDGAIFFNTYVSKGDFTFIFGDASDQDEAESLVIARQFDLAKNLRLRPETEAPTEPGFCLEHGFLASDRYVDQETASAGIYLPSLPDVTFSISSNKDAYADYKKDEFERMKRDELPLLARIRKAQALQGDLYPHRNVLREGKRDVQHWHGEESLFRRRDGTHDFEWTLVGTPKDVANPSDFSVVMYSKVEDNMVGAAKAASVSDEEAVALWDRLLSGLKFRVKVPGAPEGSYYFPKR